MKLEACVWLSCIHCIVCKRLIPGIKRVPNTATHLYPTYQMTSDIGYLTTKVVQYCDGPLWQYKCHGILIRRTHVNNFGVHYANEGLCDDCAVVSECTSEECLICTTIDLSKRHFRRQCPECAKSGPLI